MGWGTSRGQWESTDGHRPLSFKEGRLSRFDETPWQPESGLRLSLVQIQELSGGGTLPASGRFFWVGTARAGSVLEPVSSRVWRTGLPILGLWSAFPQVVVGSSDSIKLTQPVKRGSSGLRLCC